MEEIVEIKEIRKKKKNVAAILRGEYPAQNRRNGSSVEIK